MPSPLLETRTLDELVAILVDTGVIARIEDLAGAELIVGWESAVIRSRDGWIYRFGRSGEASFRRELEVLALVDGRLGVPTPRIEIIDHTHLLMGYRTITGADVDLQLVLSRPSTERIPLVHALAEVLASMHALAEPALAGDLQVPVLDAEPMVEQALAVRTRLDPERRTALDVLLAAWERTRLSGRSAEPVLLHGDFHFGNMVFTEPTGAIAGIWDFSCVELGDPAADLRYLAGDSTVLAAEVATAYSGLTGRALDVVGARLMSVLEDVTDAIAEHRPFHDAIEAWRLSGAD